MKSTGSGKRSRRRMPAQLIGLCALLYACGDDASPRTDSGSPMLDASAGDASMDASAPSDASADAQIDAARDSSDVSDADNDAANDDGGDAETDASTPLIVPTLLTETGLYEPGSVSEVVANALEYTPRYVLWSDGADKRRWLLLPDDATIDTSDVDAFEFPIGTKAFKEFSLASKKLETRMLWKTDGGWVLIAYAWNDAQTEAMAVPRGAQDVLDTDHDIPQRADCRECHDGAPDTLLGVSAVQLAHAGPGLTLDMLQAMGKLSDAPPANIERPDTLEWNALGYLHANCGSPCHNPRGGPYDRLDLDLALRVGELDDITQTQSYLTAVEVELTNTADAGTYRIAPSDSAHSGLVFRMQSRGEETSMPPLASEQVDDDGLQLVRDWIDSLSP